MIVNNANANRFGIFFVLIGLVNMHKNYLSE